MSTFFPEHVIDRMRQCWKSPWKVVEREPEFLKMTWAEVQEQFDQQVLDVRLVDEEFVTVVNPKAGQPLTLIMLTPAEMHYAAVTGQVVVGVPQAA